jgi:hypothetical protein
MGMRKNFSENYRKFGHAISKRFASPALGHGSPNFLGDGQLGGAYNLNRAPCESTKKYMGSEIRVTCYTRVLRSCESPRITKTRKKVKYNNRHFHVNLASEFFDASLSSASSRSLIRP